MVQVDVFWSYGIGSSFALAAFRQLRQLQAEWGAGDAGFGLKDTLNVRKLVKEIESGEGVAFNNQYFLKTLLFLSLLFVPSGVVLLWSNPNWETMQVGEYETIPSWLVGGFTITNVTQGILGYWITYNLLMRGKYHRAALQTILAYTGFWFILVNGWDKTGYRRFFSRDREHFEDWKWTNFFSWLTSDVVRILLSFGAAFVPLMLFWLSRWLMEGYEMDGKGELPDDPGERLAESLKVSADLLTAVFGLSLGSAITATLLIRWFGWLKGGIASMALVYLGGVSKWGIGPALLKKILRVESIEGTPVWELHDLEPPMKEKASVSA